MKHLQTYNKLFESFTEDDYQQLVDTLQGEIFDDANINFLDGVEEEEYFDNESEYPYWCYDYNFDGTIKQILICSLNSEKVRFFMSELMHHILPIFSGRTGMKYQCESISRSHKYKYIRVYLV
jgi:hypothetical protein